MDHVAITYAYILCIYPLALSEYLNQQLGVAKSLNFDEHVDNPNYTAKNGE